MKPMHIDPVAEARFWISNSMQILCCIKRHSSSAQHSHRVLYSLSNTSESSLHNMQLAVEQRSQGVKIWLQWRQVSTANMEIHIASSGFSQHQNPVGYKKRHLPSIRKWVICKQGIKVRILKKCKISGVVSKEDFNCPCLQPAWELAMLLWHKAVFVFLRQLVAKTKESMYYTCNSSRLYCKTELMSFAFSRRFWDFWPWRAFQFQFSL